MKHMEGGREGGREGREGREGGEGREGRGGEGRGGEGRGGEGGEREGRVANMTTQVHRQKSPFLIETHLAKFARFWITLATKVSFLAILSSGYSAACKKKTINTMHASSLQGFIQGGGGGGGGAHWDLPPHPRCHKTMILVPIYIHVQGLKNAVILNTSVG